MTGGTDLTVEPLGPATREAAHALLRAHWGDRVVSLGRLHDPFALPGLVALAEGALAGVATFAIEDAEMEIVTLASTGAVKGAGRTLMGALFARARADGLSRVWLITTNDNTPAIRFYQMLGMRIAAVRPGAIAAARATLKPEIPETGLDGIPIRDEIEMELVLA